MDFKKYFSLPIKWLTVPSETTLLKEQSDIFNAIDKQESVLLLLDLSAAFDTVDHVILLRRLNTRYGIKGNALRWFASYLNERRQFIQVENTRSSSVELQWGVPQGSVFGPILYTLYTAPLADIIPKHGLQFHLYADDCQIYVSFKVAQNSFQHILRLRFWCVIITTLYQLMLQSWYQKTSQSLFLLAKNLPEHDWTLLGKKQYLVGEVGENCLIQV